MGEEGTKEDGELVKGDVHEALGAAVVVAGEKVSTQCLQHFSSHITYTKAPSGKDAIKWRRCV